jgi:hypothetical protein
VTEYYVVYDIETGQAVSRGEGPAGVAALQQLEEGMATMVVPRQAVQRKGEVNLDAIRISFAASVDQDAGRVRSMFITDAPGQMETYVRKEAEARRVLAGDVTPTLFLATEAAAIGQDLHSLAQEVVDQADAWQPLAARIEAARRASKEQLATATNLSAIAAAIQIDWAAVVAPVAELTLAA